MALAFVAPTVGSAPPRLASATLAAPRLATATAAAPAASPHHANSAPVAAAGALAVAAIAASRRRAGARRRAPRQQRFNVALAAQPVSEEKKLRVLIAGGGVGGLVAAKALSCVPTLDVTILEQAGAFARFGGPIQLASNALSVLRDIDEGMFGKLMEKFTFTGYRKNGLVDALRTEWFCPFDAMKTAAESYNLPYTGVIDRPDLQEILVGELPEGTLQNSRKVTGYTVLPNFEGVKVHCKNGPDIEADVFIGADGIWSATRAQMWGETQKGPGSNCNYSGYTVFAGETVYQPEDYFEVGYKVYMGPKQYFVCSDVGRGRIQWYAFVGVAEGAQIPTEAEGKKDYIKACFQDWSTQINDLVDATPSQCIEERALYDRSPSFFKSWADGPVALMGDACHPMMPNLGQGGCQAMEDGYVLAEKLRTVTDKSQVPAVLQDYYRTRIVRTAGVQFLSRIASDLLLDTFTFPWKPSEGLSTPYGKGRGDFSYFPVVVNYLRYILPPIFNLQFTFLYSMHPFKWTAEEVKELVGKVMERHKTDAHSAWDKRVIQVVSGEADKVDASMPSFFAKVASTAPDAFSA